MNRCLDLESKGRRSAAGRILTAGLLLLLAGCLSPSTPLHPTAEPPSPQPTSAPAPSPRQALRPLVYALGGDLWSYDGVEHYVLVGDGRSYDPLLSPDGRFLLFRRHEEPTELVQDPFSLWVFELESGQERELDLSGLPTLPFSTADGRDVDLPHWPSQIVWLPDRLTVLFNSGVAFSAVGPGGWVTFDDLWLLDVESGQMLSLVPSEGQPARFAASPQGDWVLICRATRIEALHLDTGERRLLLTFPAVATYSEYAWLPEPHWLPEGLQARVAIAPADPLESEAYTLWHLDVEAGAAEKLGQVQGSVFSWSPDQLSWSPDGRQLFYVEQMVRVVLANADGSEASVVAEVSRPLILGWSPDGKTALYQDGDIINGLEAGAPLQVLPLGQVRGRMERAYWWEGYLFVVTEGRLLRVSLDGSGVQELNP